MLQKFIILCCTLPLMRTQHDCASYWQYIKYGEEVQGLMTIPSFNAQDHKLKINLIVAGKISSVSRLCHLFTVISGELELTVLCLFSCNNEPVFLPMSI